MGSIKKVNDMVMLSSLTVAVLQEFRPDLVAEVASQDTTSTATDGDKQTGGNKHMKEAIPDLSALRGNTQETATEWAEKQWKSNAAVREEFRFKEAFTAYCEAVARGAIKFSGDGKS